MADIFNHNFKKTSQREIDEEVAKELREWAELVGALSVLLRYIKIKCMHLFAKIFIDRMIFDIRIISDIELDAERLERAVEFLRRCGIGVVRGETSRAVVETILGDLKARFKPGIAKQLAIMPDVAPSTLFGDKWMVELIAHDGFKNAIIKNALEKHHEGVSATDADQASNDPWDVRGIFSETEQWLWATNRCLRNWARVLNIKESTTLINRNKKSQRP